jgi:predicted transcriptional regulator
MLTTAITIKFSQDEKEEIEELAAEDGRTVSAWCRRAIIQALREPEEPKYRQGNEVKQSQSIESIVSSGMVVRGSQLQPKIIPTAPIQEPLYWTKDDSPEIAEARAKLYGKYGVNRPLWSKEEMFNKLTKVFRQRYDEETGKPLLDLHEIPFEY